MERNILKRNNIYKPKLLRGSSLAQGKTAV